MEQIQASDPTQVNHPSTGVDGAPMAQPLRDAPLAADPASGRLSACWAQHLDQVREAQRLRHAVFPGEMGACVQTESNAALPGHDIDRFDASCEHLLVRDTQTGKVVGSNRVLTPVQARRSGEMYTETEFDLSALAALRAGMVDLGRSWVHPQYRHGVSRPGIRISTLRICRSWRAFRTFRRATANTFWGPDAGRL